jgi:hypothetical protein
VGLFVRKSVRFGPIRFNFSKSGIGTSVGVKGARVSFTPRGTYVNMGAHGIYYRQRIDVLDQDARPSRPGRPREVHGANPPARPGEIPTANAWQLVDATSEEILADINRHANKQPIAPWVGFLGILATVCAIASLQSLFGDRAQGLSTGLGAIGLIGTAAAVIAMAKRDSVWRTAPLFYEFDELAASRFAQIQQSCRSLARAQRLWRVRSDQPTWDWKRNAGAASLITRESVRIGRMRPPHIATNVEIWGLDCGQVKFFFFPDWLFVLQGGIYGAVDYGDLSLESSSTRFIEAESVPEDATVAGYTWRFVRRDGGPDQRFANNRQLPVAQYALLEFKSRHGLNIHLQASSMAAAAEFARTLVSAKEIRFHDAVPPRRPEQTCSNFGEYSPRDSALRILGLSGSVTEEEIKSAYRQMVQMYHPDKVATLASEFRELAHRRMKEINNAYAVLKDGKESDKQPHRSATTPTSQSVSFRCPHCDTKLSVPVRSAGQTGKCPTCKRPVRVPVHSS